VTTQVSDCVTAGKCVLEKDGSGQERRLARLEADHAKNATSIAHGQSAVDDVRDRLERLEAPKWGVIASWLGVVITIASLIIGSLMWVISDTRLSIEKHRALYGHPELADRSTSIDERLKAIESRVEFIADWQRQNNTTNTATLARIDERTKVLEAIHTTAHTGGH
jgi:hypothetical protein